MPKKSPATGPPPDPNGPDPALMLEAGTLAREAVRYLRSSHRARQGTRYTPQGPEAADVISAVSALTVAGEALRRLHDHRLMQRPTFPGLGASATVLPCLAELQAAFF